MMTSPRSRLLACVLCAAFLAACATPYQKARGFHLAGGGFGEKKISESAYWVYFSGNGYAGKDRVVNFWLYRCAELTVQNGYQYMFLRPGENKPLVLEDRGAAIKPATLRAGPGAMPRMLPAIMGAGNGARLVPVRGGGYTYVYVPGGTITTWNSKGTVLMYHAPLPDELVWAVDAQKVLDELAPYVTSDGETPAPKLDDVIRDAFVAHEHIDFAPEAFIPTPDLLNPMPTDAQQAGTAPILRDADDIRQQFATHPTAFHGLFRERKRIENREDAGSVTLSFMVTPNGMATRCRVVSTTFTDSAFPDAVANLACRLSFPPRDVAATVVPAFTISFTPLEAQRSM